MKHFVSTLCLAVVVLTQPVAVAAPSPAVDTLGKPLKVTLTAKGLEESITRGVDYLVKAQNPDGSWGSARKTKGLNIYCPPPGGHHGFHIGSSALALVGVIESGDTRPEVMVTINKAEKWLLPALEKLRRADTTTTYNNWGHAYGLKALCRLAKRPGVTEEKLSQYKKLAQQQFDKLHLYQDVDGGWGYLHFKLISRRPAGGSMPFTTSTVLLAIDQAEKQFGLSYHKGRKQEAIRSILRLRTPDFCYAYATGHKYYTRNPINRPAGSLARSQVCNSALRVNGDKRITDEVLVTSLDRLVKRNGWLDIGRKRPIPHETHFSVSGYFYLYGHYYAADSIHFLPQDQQKEWKRKIAQILVNKQEAKVGSWWDYPLYDYHEAYGTGYALSALSRLRWE